MSALLTPADIMPGMRIREHGPYVFGGQTPRTPRVGSVIAMRGHLILNSPVMAWRPDNSEYDFAEWVFTDAARNVGNGFVRAEEE